MDMYLHPLLGVGCNSWRRHQMEAFSRYWSFVREFTDHWRPQLRQPATLAREGKEDPYQVRTRHLGGSQPVLPLLWRDNGCDSVWNHLPHDCLLNRLFRRRSKKTSKLRDTGLCAGNSPVPGEFPAQIASNAENVSIWWRLHAAPKRLLPWLDGINRSQWVKLCPRITFVHAMLRVSSAVLDHV